jgi:hypothetical protein
MKDIDRRRQWFAAAQKLSLSVEKCPDWPERLALSVIASLDNSEDSAGMHRFLEAEADAGRLPTETRECQSKERRRQGVTSTYITGASHVIESASRVRTVRTRSAHAADVARLLGNAEVGPWLAAWLAPYRVRCNEAIEVAAVQSAPAAPKTQKERVEYWLSECERRAKEQNLPFDRKCMPGKKAEFLTLLHALDADLKTINKVESLNNYLKQCKCTWPADAGTQESALPMYAKLFPTAKGLGGEVKADQRHEA